MRHTQKIHFINRVDNNNIGDWICSPLSYYYDFFQNHTIFRHDIENIHWLEIGPWDVVIMGAGGILHCCDGFQANIRRLYETTPHVLAWSVGFNTHYNQEVTLAIEVERFRLIGIRDYAHPSGLPYLPCVSCLASALRKRAAIKREIGIIEHPSFQPIEGLPYEKIGNNVNFDILTDFIASSEVILATSYHAAYWSMLMGKRVICIPWSDKFEYFRHKPVFYSGDIHGDIAKTTIHEAALDEDIALNNAFFLKVQEYLESAITDRGAGDQRLNEMARLAYLDYRQGKLALAMTGHTEHTHRQFVNAHEYADNLRHHTDNRIDNLRHHTDNRIDNLRRHADAQTADARCHAAALHEQARERTADALSYAQSRLDDLLQRSGLRKITALCFGTGSMAENLLPAFRPEGMEIKAFIDERPSMRGATCAGSPVIDFSQISGCSFDYILVACRPAETISARLISLSIPAEKIVSLDVETFFRQREALDDVCLRAALLAYVRNFPGLIQAIDVPALLESPWIRGVRNRIKRAGKLEKTYLPEGVSITGRLDTTG